MTLREGLFWLQNTPVAHSISKSHHLVGAFLQIVHIAGFIALLAAVVMLTLRRFDWVLTNVPRARIEREFGRILWWGLALALASGVLMFVASPILYFYNRAFELKLAMLLVAVAVQIALLKAPRPAVVTAASVVLWFAVGVAGRAIGFI